MKISSKYKEISDGINSAQLRGSDIVAFVDQMRTDINNSEISTEDIDKKRLESQIITTSELLSINNVTYSNQLLKFVGNMQKYITDNYTSVDDFLSDNSIRVKSTFADISSDAGYPILPENISDVS